ncbi:hypothetical protein PLESTB_001347800 [Pleodorina starrii]|uniref:Uncharacterized protein n=1 Tax=Pleodorina starrii TaxID=330485 RepID=A0A9W6F767_9CHLO|nr:hypothetical protein PLESTM_000896300 [Pleodorina starrii]GLC58335.1 hypothetical protein PLESTB_001347800 [Pleodorina starrii]GLC69426.1 hypothetical protein PLESTF_000829500 [Pleodorina starrii]
MAPTDDFVTSDAFGDFFFFGASNPSGNPSGCQSLPTSPHNTGIGTVFTFPVRSNKTTPSNKQLSSSPPVEASRGLPASTTADATATLMVLAPKQAVERDCKLGKGADDVKASSAACAGASPDVPGGERGYGRSTSLDTAFARSNRDQSTADGPAPTRADDGTKPLCSFSAQENPCLYAQYVAARRSGSMGGGSGGGAGPGAAHHHHHHQGFWHSTEWWRSFSSSRLNEMAAEEPDMRSAEMRKVPYVGGAEPMCVLVHGEEERRPQ